MSEKKAKEDREREGVWTRDQKYGGVGEEVEPLDSPEKADETQFIGFKAEEDI